MECTMPGRAISVDEKMPVEREGVLDLMGEGAGQTIVVFVADVRPSTRSKTDQTRVHQPAVASPPDPANPA